MHGCFERYAVAIAASLLAVPACSETTVETTADVTSASAGAGGSGAIGGSGGSPGTGGFGGCQPIPPPVADACITDVSASPDHVFACDGVDYLVSVPDACVSCACGLVLDVHGFTMSGEMEEANTKLAELGRQHGYIVVQPSAPGSPASWSAGTHDPLVFTMLMRTVLAFNVDPARVHFTGFSQGGDMTWRFLCDHSDVLASVAPAGFGNGNDACFSQGSPPSSPRPILYLHGTADALVPFSTATASRDAVIAAEGLMQGASVSSDADHTWTRYDNAEGAVLEFLEHDYTGAAVLGGHCYPGSTDPGGLPGQFFSFACDPPNAFNWGDAVMSFFIAHPKP